MNGFSKILIYGGSFDPPHKGHTDLLLAAAEHVKPDAIYIFPAYHSPLKRKSNTRFSVRKAMIKIAVGNTLPADMRSKIIIDTFEMKQKGKTYTYQTIKYLKRKHPKSELFLLMGGDCILQFDKWKRTGEIAKNAVIVVGKRTDSDLEEIKHNFKFELLQDSFPDVSSTGVRAEIFSTGEISKLVAEPVRDFIVRHKLYALEAHKWIRQNLKPNRLAHTMAVTKLAQQLAMIYKIDTNTAAIAGLLHDAGKHFSNQQLIDYVKRHRVKIRGFRDIAKNEPGLLHSFVSADMAKKIFKVTDQSVLKAIKNHTLGAKKMGVLSKILYAADISADGRDFEEAGIIREAAFRNLDKALFMAVQVKLGYVFAHERWLCPYGLELWNSLIEKKEKPY